MKTIVVQTVIEGIRARKDGSLGVTFSTPELRPEEKTSFFELQNQNNEMTIKPLDESAPEEIRVDADLNHKSQSQRIRDVLFILWKKDPMGLEFDEYYKRQTEKIINWLKSKIDL